MFAKYPRGLGPVVAGQNMGPKINKTAPPHSTAKTALQQSASGTSSCDDINLKVYTVTQTDMILKYTVSIWKIHLRMKLPHQLH